MFNIQRNFATLSADPALFATSVFFHEHATAMLNAAALLGGPSAHRRCLRFLSDLADSVSLSRRLKLELVWLHRLLSLENVGDPDSEETARFAMLDLLDPRVEEICLETDRLLDLLITIAELHPDCDAVSPEYMDRFAA